MLGKDEDGGKGLGLGFEHTFTASVLPSEVTAVPGLSAEVRVRERVMVRVRVWVRIELRVISPAPLAMKAAILSVVPATTAQLGCVKPSDRKDGPSGPSDAPGRATIGRTDRARPWSFGR